jgi:hypothetical protein
MDAKSFKGCCVFDAGALDMSHLTSVIQSPAECLTYPVYFTCSFDKLNTFRKRVRKAVASTEALGAV